MYKNQKTRYTHLEILLVQKLKEAMRQARGALRAKEDL